MSGQAERQQELERRLRPIFQIGAGVVPALVLLVLGHWLAALIVVLITASTVLVARRHLG
jgi:hypothetical protein